ncbi:hypothetical protein DAPPUDRAFT_326690 [Daphnia pulex]|uniref:Endonuclease/exonuclease/phosphatase domain-containing protein n=1 Tax=Daphnia pulex TaxID=6669 RepID=E9H8I1_DAPPU|nr:hypothetical protein DAPPUDRAFT_326690 [Daphnia pulex]|eukprot:EFX71973.1 hypothetical protein DAPPUDRAFT_326690 [Daphnia pulex]
MFNLSQNSLSNPVNFPNRLKCLQINLQHSCLASASLAQVVLDLDIDVVLIQEPYALLTCPPVVATSQCFSAFHMLSDDHAYGTVSAILDAIASPFVVIGTDVNAKSMLWNCRCNEKRGEELEKLLTSSNLNVANRSLAELDFVPGNTSFVDLTLSGDQVKILCLLFLAIPSLSDNP